MKTTTKTNKNNTPKHSSIWSKLKKPATYRLGWQCYLALPVAIALFVYTIGLILDNWKPDQGLGGLAVLIAIPFAMGAEILYICLLKALAEHSVLANVIAAFIVPFGYYQAIESIFNIYASGPRYTQVNNNYYYTDKLQLHVGNWPHALAGLLFIVYIASAIHLRQQKIRAKHLS